MKTVEEIYQNHAEMPYLAPKYEEELLRKPIPKRNMIRTAEGLLPGHIIMLWRIQFGTFTNQSAFHKYFYTTYGIDAQRELTWLIEQGYITVDSAFDSLCHLSAPRLKEFLKSKGVTRLSKMKRAELEQAVAENYGEDELGQLFSLRGYAIAQKGKEALEAHPEIVAKHPQKSF